MIERIILIQNDNYEKASGELLDERELAMLRWNDKYVNVSATNN